MARDTIKLGGDFGIMKKALIALRFKGMPSVMDDIKSKYMRPMARRSWSTSGLHQVSGELRKAMNPFSGQVSAGVGLKTKRGKDLILPKAVTHTYGVKKGSYTKKSRTTPWGDIPARPFMPQSMPGGYVAGSEKLIRDFVDAEFKITS